MTEEQAKRKLAAILRVDVKGYSRLMGEDEQNVASISTQFTIEAGLEAGAELPERNL